MNDCDELYFEYDDTEQYIANANNNNDISNDNESNNDNDNDNEQQLLKEIDTWFNETYCLPSIIMLQPQLYEPIQIELIFLKENNQQLLIDNEEVLFEYHYLKNYPRKKRPFLFYIIKTTDNHKNGRNHIGCYNTHVKLDMFMAYDYLPKKHVDGPLQNIVHRVPENNLFRFHGDAPNGVCSSQRFYLGLSNLMEHPNLSIFWKINGEIVFEGEFFPLHVVSISAYNRMKRQIKELAKS